jgi:hypothetical protein
MLDSLLVHDGTPTASDVLPEELIGEEVFWTEGILDSKKTILFGGFRHLHGCCWLPFH